MKRREILKIAGIAGCGVLGSLSMMPVMAKALQVTSLGHNLSLISGAGCNVVVAVGSDSVVVVDGGSAKNADALLSLIMELAEGKPITTLFNTNWRPEHTGLNYLLGDSAEIIAHENTRLWQGADFYVEWENRHYSSMPVNAQANSSFYKLGEMQLGTEIIEYGYLPQAHTDGDIYVRFINANVLVVSDLLGVGAYPVLDYVSGGWIGGMQDASLALIELTDEHSQVIASTGAVQAQTDLQAQSLMLGLAREKIGDSFRSGWSLENFKASDPAADFGAQWGDPDLFLTQLYRGTWYHIPGRAVRNVV